MTLVGKGVCFDTGGLDLKPSSGMLIMKKDMGGAANVLALAQHGDGRAAQVRLRVLVPAVENAVSGKAFRPLDIFRAKGMTVEIGNTDAEGRLVLADALALANEEAPELLIDLATLTGAARVALGPDLPPFYTNDEALAADVARCAAKRERSAVADAAVAALRSAGSNSKVADIDNAPSGGFAGSITSALFLQRFVDAREELAACRHYGWTPRRSRRGRKAANSRPRAPSTQLLEERYA